VAPLASLRGQSETGRSYKSERESAVDGTISFKELSGLRARARLSYYIQNKS